MPTIQLLSRSNYEDQHLVAIEPNLPELAPSSIRIQTTIISLTANNLTYGRIGHLLGIWEIYPLPPSTPVEFSDPKKFGRIGAWGYATVLQSNVFEIEVGTQVFGLLPIGTLPQDMQIRISPQAPGQFFEISKHREKAMSLYNQYLFYSPAQQTVEQKNNQGQDALFLLFFMTSYLMNRFAFPWDISEFVEPGTANDGWTAEKGTIDDKTIVLVFADSGKTALAFAYLLRNRPIGSKPRTVVGIGSSASRAFVKRTELYDKLLTYDSDSTDLDVGLDLKPDSKVVICELGSRGGAASRWARKLRQSHENVVEMVVAGEIVQESPEKATQRFLARGKTGASGFNTSAAREKVLKLIGDKKYLEQFLQDWSLFKDRGLVKGLDMIWGEGVEAAGKGWEKLCRGEVGSNQGLVFALH